MVLLHGWGLHGGVFARVAANLSQDYCVHCVDLPGHGASATISPYTLSGVAHTIATHFPFPAHVVGWSLGGLVAQRWALDQPTQLLSLTLVASTPCFTQRADWPCAQPAATLQQFATALTQAFEPTLQRFLALQTLGSDSARDTLAALKQTLFAHGRPLALQEALALLAHEDLRTEIEQLRPTLHLMAGAKDALTPLGSAHWLEKIIPDTHLTVFPRASHAPFLSHEAEFLLALRAFLQHEGC